MEHARIPAMRGPPAPLAADATPLAREVYRRMVARGMRQRELALRAGLNETYVRDILAGRSRNPRRDQLALLARALDCEIGDLPSGQPLSGSSSQEVNRSPSNDPERIEPVDPSSVLPLYPSEVALIRLWRILPPNVRDEVLERITSLLPRSPYRR